MTKWDTARDPSILGQLLALLAHDLRNPLSALHSNLGYLRTVTSRSPAADPDIPEAIGDGLVSCDGLSHIIDNLSFFSQQLRGAAHPAPVSGAVTKLVQEALAQVGSFAKSHGVALSLVSAEGASEAHIRVSREVFSRAVGNMIRNAVQFTPPGGDALLRVDADEATARVTVFDRGPDLRDEHGGAGFGLDSQLLAKKGSDGRYSRWLGLFIADIAADALGGSLSSVAPREPFSSALELSIPRVA